MRRCFPLLLILSLVTLGIMTCAPFQLAAQNCHDEAEVSEPQLDPDFTTFAPGESFTVSWTVRNSGDCTWTRSYRLIFVDGERMESPRTVRLSESVQPGDSITVELELSAPAEEGEYSGTWQLRNSGGDNFGPPLTLAIAVAQGQSASGEIVLPEVLVFSGIGDGGHPNAIANCVTDGALPESAALIVNTEELEYRHTTLYLCSLSEGEEVTVAVTSPGGDLFQRSYVQGAPETGSDNDQNEYTGTVTTIDLGWITQALSGEWQLDISSDELSERTTFDLPPAFESSEVYPHLDNWPSGPIDPFAGAGGCHYQYQPGQEMILAGTALTPTTMLQIGVYHIRFGSGYFAGQEVVHTDENGAFTLTFHAPSEAGMYNVVSLEKVDPAGYQEGDTQYDLSLSGSDSYSACFSVAPANASNEAIRLAVAAGKPGLAETNVFDYETGKTYYPTYTGGSCDSSEAGWWRGGEWLVYQSNCVTAGSGFEATAQSGDQYDLYTASVMHDFFEGSGDLLVQLTDTPDLDETEPDGNSDGLIVYRQVLTGTAPEASGELWLLDSNDGSGRALGLSGRAPAWSPDGKRIAFMSDLEGSWQIYVFDVADETLKLVSTGCRSHCRMPAWSPDGKQIIYEVSASSNDLTPAGLWTSAANGSGHPRRFLAGPYGHPSWSSSGWIAFEGPDGIYRTQEEHAAGSTPAVELYFYSDPNWLDYYAPVWSH